MKEIIVLSGKGGTGKTSVSAAFATIAPRPLVIDCDVDAPDLHLILQPKIKHTFDFFGNRTANIQAINCHNCGRCYEVCRFNAISKQAGENTSLPVEYRVEASLCEGCGLCARECPHQTIAMENRPRGQWYISDTRVGTMLHARLDVAGENSGKLVSILRREARTIAEQEGVEYLIVDGPPGIGCPVTASLSGADKVVIVTEPTISGVHDLKRLVTLLKHFKVPAGVIINRWDINAKMSESIGNLAREEAIAVLGLIPYTHSFTAAQLLQKSIVESDESLSEVFRTIWSNLVQELS